MQNTKEPEIERLCLPVGYREGGRACEGEIEERERIRGGIGRQGEFREE